MSDLKVKQSTTRTRDVVLKPGIVNEIVFEDTRPNYVHINNFGSGKLYVSLKGIPSVDRYDKIVPSYGEELYGEDTGNSRVQIFSENTQPVSIRITSFEAPFDPLILVGRSAPSSGGGGGGGTASVVSINGFSVALPSGDNNIGRVKVTEMPAQTMTLATLPAGTNNIGKVNVETLPPLPAGSSRIGDVGIVGGITITSMPAMSFAGAVEITNTEFSMAAKDDHTSYNGSVGTTEVVVNLPYAVKNFNYIVNDDPTNDLLIAFGTGVTTDSENGLNRVIRLKPGESLADFRKNATVIKFRRTAGTGNVRFLGV